MATYKANKSPISYGAAMSAPLFAFAQPISKSDREKSNCIFGLKEKSSSKKVLPPKKGKAPVKHAPKSSNNKAEPLPAGAVFSFDVSKSTNPQKEITKLLAKKMNASAKTSSKGQKGPTSGPTSGFSFAPSSGLKGTGGLSFGTPASGGGGFSFGGPTSGTGGLSFPTSTTGGGGFSFGGPTSGAFAFSAPTTGASKSNPFAGGLITVPKGSTMNVPRKTTEPDFSFTWDNGLNVVQKRAAAPAVSQGVVASWGSGRMNKLKYVKCYNCNQKGHFGRSCAKHVGDQEEEVTPKK
jgi:hypothetical protein